MLLIPEVYIVRRRGSGILLHVTSLPSPFGVGDLGPSAYRFVDFLAEARQSFWQVLPLTPSSLGGGGSPYNAMSAFAGNPLLISPERLVEDGWLAPEDLEAPPDLPEHRVDYPKVYALKRGLLERAFERSGRRRRDPDYQWFVEAHATWLEDYALFVALSEHFRNQSWDRWPPPLRDRHPVALDRARRRLGRRVAMEKFWQYLFFRQWQALRAYARERGIQIIGDLPLYVDFHSADVWVHPDLFRLDDQKRPTHVTGVPPDYFSATGQRWGHPVYRWDVLQQRGYDWWVRRIAHNLSLYDLVRVDHFRGFVAYWEIPAHEPTAVYGHWVEAPAEDFFRTLSRHFPCLPIIAEDLGVITPDVREVMERWGFPGMRVLLFAFGPDMSTNPYAPHNHVRHCVVYTGTHDNNTVRGWFEQEASDEDRHRLFRYLGRTVTADEVAWEMVRLAMMSVADRVVIPMQDVLGLGAEARMNTPATTAGNWEWRLPSHRITPELARRLADLTETYGRV
ncbi:MAG: 4-alpha-glucanotransferase [Acidobacteria bacterium]|nr:4-alpha-glucanotransferase [Acidobacteriota bacterium]MDW7984172.1 4-alpha-glucanotransferase [Acidobacteriota bacterium]